MCICNAKFHSNERKGRGKGKARREPAPLAELQPEDVLGGMRLFTPRTRCPNRVCGFMVKEGTLKCPMCRTDLIEPTDMNIATEIRHLEFVAMNSGRTLALDMIDFDKQPRSMRMTETAASTAGKRAGRSNYGVIKQSARNHVRSTAKKGYSNLIARLETDAFYQYNCALSNLLPHRLEFIGTLARCMVPDPKRSAEEIAKRMGTGVQNSAGLGSRSFQLFIPS